MLHAVARSLFDAMSHRATQREFMYSQPRTRLMLPVAVYVYDSNLVKRGLALHITRMKLLTIIIIDPCRPSNARSTL